MSISESRMRSASVSFGRGAGVGKGELGHVLDVGEISEEGLDNVGDTGIALGAPGSDQAIGLCRRF